MTLGSPKVEASKWLLADVLSATGPVQAAVFHMISVPGEDAVESAAVWTIRIIARTPEHDAAGFGIETMFARQARPVEDRLQMMRWFGSDDPIPTAHHLIRFSAHKRALLWEARLLSRARAGLAVSSQWNDTSPPGDSGEVHDAGRASASATRELLERVAAAAGRDPDRIGPILQAIVGDDPKVPGKLRPVAGRLNEARLSGAFEEFRSVSLTTGEVQSRLGLRSRRAVHALRRRGDLIGRTLGSRTFFPGWQFDASALRSDLPALLRALRRFSTDAVAADRVMRLPRPELDGVSLVEALEDPARHDIAWALLNRLGEP